ncbi:sensor histidine kinase [Neptunicoccus sediminis]|uniref:sensor histidine kinase n=1 Tax=Neptunicoccus sediminis TaxID=1892596 RepID=UPI000846199E|nr:HAMP domain-containing sensor histidine kinase [Neptunicoccus sediminis]
MVLVAAALGVAALALTVFSNWTAPRVERDLAAELAARMLTFERELGYGGLIHNFKNYLLRPEETAYRDAAQQNVDRLLTELDGLSELVQHLDMVRGFEATRNVINQYSVAIKRVETLHSQGLIPAQIDDRVRIDDSSAFENIQQVATAARAELATRATEQARRTATFIRAIVLLLGAFLISVGVVFVFLIAERRRRARELAAAHIYAEELEDMARIATHDIRSPLKQIAFLVQEVITDCTENKGRLGLESRDDLELIRQRTLRVDAMVEGTLGLMRTSALADRIELVDLRVLVRSIIEMDAPPHLPVVIEGGDRIRIDKAKLTIVLRNLISNAVKHGTSADPNLLIRLVQKQQTVEISVEYNGPGIAEEHRERIFTLFATLDGTGQEGKIAGIGLPMVRKIVRNLGGEIAVAGSSLGGAAFCVTLPR